jgi:hypothetical protein
MIVVLAGVATVVAVVTCDALRIVRPDAPLPKAAVYTAAALLAIVSVSIVTRLTQLL